jgi:4-alpha-glucanotransferase
MKKFLIPLLSVVLWSCNGQTASSPAEVAETVVVSFYTHDNNTLQKFTTKESYESFMTVQDLLSAEEKKASEFNVLNEKIDSDVAWIKFTSSYSDEPETFKLVKEGGQWKVTEKGDGEKGPF